MSVTYGPHVLDQGLPLIRSLEYRSEKAILRLIVLEASDLVSEACAEHAWNCLPLLTRM
jgi:hypothetical protein